MIRRLPSVWLRHGPKMKGRREPRKFFKESREITYGSKTDEFSDALYTESRFLNNRLAFSIATQAGIGWVPCRMIF